MPLYYYDYLNPKQHWVSGAPPLEGGCFNLPDDKVALDKFMNEDKNLKGVARNLYRLDREGAMVVLWEHPNPDSVTLDGLIETPLEAITSRLNPYVGGQLSKEYLQDFKDLFGTKLTEAILKSSALSNEPSKQVKSPTNPFPFGPSL